MTEKKVAFITGVARGQGRAHAVKLASKGMNIIGLDICADIPSMDYPNATEDDLLATVKLVEALATKFEPDKFKDKYREQVEALIAAKIQCREVASGPSQQAPAAPSGSRARGSCVRALARKFKSNFSPPIPPGP